MSTAHEILDQIEDDIKAAEEQAARTNENDLIVDIKRRQALKAQIDALQDELAFLDEQLAKLIDKKFEYTEGDLVTTTVVVRAERTDVDLKMLEHIDARLFAAVTKPALDNDKFKEAKALHLFDDGQPAAKAVTIKYNKPSIRTTTKKHTLKETN